jgi:hypothetical protein
MFSALGHEKCLFCVNRSPVVLCSGAKALLHQVTQSYSGTVTLLLAEADKGGYYWHRPCASKWMWLSEGEWVAETVIEWVRLYLWDGVTRDSLSVCVFFLLGVGEGRRKYITCEWQARRVNVSENGMKRVTEQVSNSECFEWVWTLE